MFIRQCSFDAISCKCERIISNWQSFPVELANICVDGQSSEKNYAYECGLLKSHLVKDDFHKLLCKEGRLTALGEHYFIDFMCQLVWDS